MAKAITESKKKQKKSDELDFSGNFSYSGKDMDKHAKAKKSRTQSVSRMNPVAYKKGGSVKKKKSSGKAIRGKGCEIK